MDEQEQQLRLYGIYYMYVFSTLCTSNESTSREQTRVKEDTRGPSSSQLEKLDQILVELCDDRIELGG